MRERERKREKAGSIIECKMKTGKLFYFILFMFVRYEQHQFHILFYLNLIDRYIGEIVVITTIMIIIRRILMIIITIIIMMIMIIIIIMTVIKIILIIVIMIITTVIVIMMK